MQRVTLTDVELKGVETNKWSTLLLSSQNPPALFSLHLPCSRSTTLPSPPPPPFRHKRALCACVCVWSDVTNKSTDFSLNFFTLANILVVRHLESTKKGFLLAIFHPVEVGLVVGPLPLLLRRRHRRRRRRLRWQRALPRKFPHTFIFSLVAESSAGAIFPTPFLLFSSFPHTQREGGSRPSSWAQPS